MTAALLVVDDEREMLHVLARLLEPMGRVRCVASVAEARAVLAVERVDVVITDYRMPGESGAVLAAELAATRPGVPVIVLSGMEPELKPASVFRWVAKPFRGADLRAVVAAALTDAATRAPT